MVTLVRRHAAVLSILVGILSGCGDEDRELPALASLEVSGGSDFLFPEFDSEIRHYGIRCESSNLLRLTATAASPRQKLLVDGSVSARGHLDFEVDGPSPDQDIVIEATQSGRTATYTVHCIPLDVPDIDISVSTPKVSRGLLFLTPQFSEAGQRKTYLLILDNNGVPRFQRKIDGRAVDFKRHPNGLYTYALQIRQNEFGLNDHVIVVLDEKLQEEDRLATVGLTQTDNHDFIFTEEETRIFISYNSTIRDMTAYGLSASEVVGDSVIQEVDRSGNVVFQWNSWDYIDVSDCQQTGYPVFPGDYAHLNSISLTKDGDLIASFRGCGQVLLIDRPSGNVKFYLGGSKSDFSIVGDPFSEFCGQHTAWQLDSGNVLMFDNGSFCLGDRESRFGQFSRAVEYRLNFDTGQAEFVRDYSLSGSYQDFTRSQGSVQSLPSGNWLIGWGNGPNVSVSEVNALGEIVLEMRLSVDGGVAVSYRAFRSEMEEVP